MSWSYKSKSGSTTSVKNTKKRRRLSKEGTNLPDNTTFSDSEDDHNNNDNNNYISSRDDDDEEEEEGEDIFPVPVGQLSPTPSKRLLFPTGAPAVPTTPTKMDAATILKKKTDKTDYVSEDADSDLEVDGDIPDIQSATTKQPITTVTASSEMFDGVTVSKRVLKRVLSHVKSKLIGRKPCQLCLLDEEYSKLYQLLQQTIEEGEGNSCLLVGPKASGKTLLVSTVVESLRKKYSGQFITVKLSGHSQTDDNIALREITRQIDLHLQSKYRKNAATDTKVEKDDGDNNVNYDTTYAEDNKEAEEQAPLGPSTLQKRSMSETLQSLLKIFSQYEDHEENNKEIVSVIFILEEFDKFAQHGRQTLLYNLFDIAQSSKAPIAVIGVTAKINARDMLEKRVRSRFSQRIHQLKRANTLEDFWTICKSSLMVDAAEFISEYENNVISTSTTISPLSESDKSFLDIWNQYIEWLYDDKLGNFYRILEQVFYTTKDVREFFNKVLLGVIMSDPFPKQVNFLLYEREKSIADTQGFIEGLSELELSLIICAARVQIKLEIESLNFNLVYEEYFQMASQFKQERMANMSSLSLLSNSGMGTGGDSSSALSASGSLSVAGYRIWSRDIARAGWERLESMNLLISLGGSTGNRGMGANTRDEIKMMKVDVGLMELAKIMGSRHPLKQWTRL